MGTRAAVSNPIPKLVRTTAESDAIAVVLDSSRWVSVHFQGIRHSAPATSLELHVDVASKPDPDGSADEDWVLDRVVLDMNTGVAPLSFGGLMNPDETVPHRLRLRMVHTGIDAEYEVYVDGKEHTR